MTLHDWIDELCDALEIDTEVDEGLILDLARVAADSVERPAAPVTTFLVGYAAALRGGDISDVEMLAGRAQILAEKWAGDAISVDDFTEADLEDDLDVEVAVEDDAEVAEFQS